MYISSSLLRVQQRIAELHPRPPAPAARAAETTFSGVLADKMAVAGPAPAEPRGEVTAPPDLRSYGNGRIPAAALTSVGIGHHRLAGPAARGFIAMTEEAASSGIHIGVTDSYRNYDQQVDLARRKGLYSQGGLAATPGTSNHGWGLAVDLDLDARGQAWMRSNAGRYGFVEDTPREPWHWAYQRTDR